MATHECECDEAVMEDDGRNCCADQYNKRDLSGAAIIFAGGRSGAQSDAGVETGVDDEDSGSGLQRKQKPQTTSTRERWFRWRRARWPANWM